MFEETIAQIVLLCPNIKAIATLENVLDWENVEDLLRLLKLGDHDIQLEHLGVSCTETQLPSFDILGQMLDFVPLTHLQSLTIDCQTLRALEDADKYATIHFLRLEHLTFATGFMYSDDMVLPLTWIMPKLTKATLRLVCSSSLPRNHPFVTRFLLRHGGQLLTLDCLFRGAVLTHALSLCPLLLHLVVRDTTFVGQLGTQATILSDAKHPTIQYIDIRTPALCSKSSDLFRTSVNIVKTNFPSLKVMRNIKILLPMWPIPHYITPETFFESATDSIEFDFPGVHVRCEKYQVIATVAPLVEQDDPDDKSYRGPLYYRGDSDGSTYCVDSDVDLDSSSDDDDESSHSDELPDVTDTDDPLAESQVLTIFDQMHRHSDSGTSEPDDSGTSEPDDSDEESDLSALGNAGDVTSFQAI